MSIESSDAPVIFLCEIAYDVYVTGASSSAPPVPVTQAPAPRGDDLDDFGDDEGNDDEEEDGNGEDHQGEDNQDNNNGNGNNNNEPD